MSQPIRRALVSVFEKTGIVELCRDLARREVQILSSGGTAQLLRENGIPVTSVSDYTGSPELLDGRVKTLHPRIHAGILAVRSNAEHMAQLARAGIEPIDLVVVNLYPFEKTAARADAAEEDVIEMIDVGGPTMVRAAAKNSTHVGVVVDPADYAEVGRAVTESGSLPAELLRRLAAKAFARTSAYDAAVAAYLGAHERGGTAGGAGDPFPARLVLDLTKVADLRYGENPHQRAAFYRDAQGSGPSLAGATKLQGKELSFNNILDLDAAVSLVADLGPGACGIIKHGNPCGVALGAEPALAFRAALECDPVSAFGGVIAFFDPVDGAAAQAIAEAFYEAVVAPRFDERARQALSAKKNLRLLEVGDLSWFSPGGQDLRRVHGGLLVQDWDHVSESVREGRVVTRRAPTDEEWQALRFSWIVARHVKSNAIVYARADRTLGIGAGQMSRVDSARIGMQKARSPLAGAVLASDAFFPFRDGIDVAAEAGIRAVVQPGGSVRDEEVIAAADEHGLAMVFTERRHFRH